MSYKCDPELGKEVHKVLMTVGVETPMHLDKVKTPDSDKIAKIAELTGQMLSTLGLDLSDDSLIETPARVAKMYVREIFYGLNYDNFPKCTTVENKMHYDEMVIEKNITVYSDCEHHLRPIHGVAHVAYIPNEVVLGLSKINRIVDFFSRRPQIQERLVEQIYHALSFILKTDNVAVVIEAEHFCVKQRGIQDSSSSTMTSKLGGNFRLDGTVRAEFLNLIRC